MSEDQPLLFAVLADIADAEAMNRVGSARDPFRAIRDDNRARGDRMENRRG